MDKPKPGARAGVELRDPSTLTRRERIQLAAASGVDDRTISKVARGEFVRGSARDRAIKALKEEGFAVPAGAPPPPPKPRGPRKKKKVDPEAVPAAAPSEPTRAPKPGGDACS